MVETDNIIQKFIMDHWKEFHKLNQHLLQYTKQGLKYWSLYSYRPRIYGIGITNTWRIISQYQKYQQYRTEIIWYTYHILVNTKSIIITVVYISVLQSRLLLAKFHKMTNTHTHTHIWNVFFVFRGIPKDID